MRRKELEHLVTTGEIDGKRSRSSYREKMLDSITVCLRKDKPTPTISCTWNRERWRHMVANAMKSASTSKEISFFKEILLITKI